MLVTGSALKKAVSYSWAGIILLLSPDLAAAAGSAAKPGGTSLLAGLAAAFVLLLLAIVLILSLAVRQARPLFKFAGSVFGSVKQALVENPDIKALVERHPRISQFLANRFDRGRFSGLTLTILSLFFFYTLIQFLGVVQSLLASDPIVAADLRLANLLSTFRTPGLDRFFLFVTLLGKWPVVLAFAWAVSGILFLWRKWIFIPGLWVCVAGASASTWLGKITFQRQRPAVAEYVEWSYSFPSGHAVISVALYGFFLYLVWRFFHRHRDRVLALFAGTAVILAVGTSRLYLGVHYLSDVWGGYLLGLMWLFVGISLSEAGAGKWPVPPPLRGSGQRKAASWLVSIAALGVYLALGTIYHPPARTQSQIPAAASNYDISSIFTENRLSRYSETLTGKNQEPLSFLIASPGDKEFINAFKVAGWTLASSETIHDLIQAGKAALLNRPDATAPMTPSFWEGRPHDFGFQKPLEHPTVRERHHARFWKTGLTAPDGLDLYVGTASLDVGLKWGIAHRIKANIDGEREYLFSDLVQAGVVAGYAKTDFVEPVFGHNFIGDPFFTDGKIYPVTLE